MSQIDQTAEELMESLCGYDFIAIAHNFGDTIANLAEKDPAMMLLALVFIAKRRQGATDDDARNAAMAMPFKEVTAFFAETTEEESGKDESPETSPATSLSSVS